MFEENIGISWAYTDKNASEVVVMDLQTKVVVDYSDEETG